MWLPSEVFRTVVESTPLVSIDLIVENQQNEILLGQRLNRPAQGYWFVPGGRVLKNEALDDAFLRLTHSELGRAFERKQAQFLGVYEHFYTDSVFGTEESDPDTHYVVLGYRIKLMDDHDLAPLSEQHSGYRWWRLDDVQLSNAVHTNTRLYISALRDLTFSG